MQQSFKIFGKIVNHSELTRGGDQDTNGQALRPDTCLNDLEIIQFKTPRCKKSIVWLAFCAVVCNLRTLEKVLQRL